MTLDEGDMLGFDGRRAEERSCNLPLDIRASGSSTLDVLAKAAAANDDAKAPIGLGLPSSMGSVDGGVAGAEESTSELGAPILRVDVVVGYTRRRKMDMLESHEGIYLREQRTVDERAVGHSGAHGRAVCL